MSTGRLTLSFVTAVALVVTGCVCVSPDQAVNISEVHDGIVRLMPYAQDGIRVRIAEQQAVVDDATRTQEDRDAAVAAITSLQGRLMETALLPGVSAPIRDWAIANVGTETYIQAKQDRDAQIGGSSGSH